MTSVIYSLVQDASTYTGSAELIFILLHNKKLMLWHYSFKLIYVFLSNNKFATCMLVPKGYSWRVSPMRPKAREMTQHGGPPGWLEESNPSRWALCCDGRSMPPSLTDPTACPGLELLSCKLLEHPAAAADVPALNVHKTSSWALSRKEGMGQNSS